MCTRDAAVEIWLVDLARGAAAIAQVGRRLAIEPLPPSGTATAALSDLDRRTAYLGLRLLIARHDGLLRARLPFFLEAHGKPALASADLSASPGPAAFNLAHSHGMALIALSHLGPVGIDIQAAGAMPLSAARREVLERTAIRLGRGRPLPGDTIDARTRQAWVRLEAVAKATGEGIGHLLERLAVRPGCDAETEFALVGEPKVTDLPMPTGLLAAIAIVFGSLPPVVHVTPLPTDVTALEALVTIAKSGA